MWRWNAVAAFCCGSDFESSIWVSVSVRSSSNSDSGNDGWRSTSPVKRSTAARFSRVVSIETVAWVELPASWSCAFRRSSSSWICSRVFWVVPRRSIAGTCSPAVARFCSDASSPRWKVIATFTVAPRVFLGSSASLAPEASVERSTRASTAAGAGSKASPAAIASRPL